MRLIGYMELIERFHLDVLRPPLASYLLEKGRRNSREMDGRTDEFYPPRDNPGDTWTEQLLFALKHEGINLEVLSALFRTAPSKELVACIAAAPTGRYTRKAWFLYEWLLNKKLPLEDAEQGNYVPILEEDEYYALPITGTELHVRRQRVINNLPGTREYCPLVRRTAALKHFEARKLDHQANKIILGLSPKLIHRAAQYLYIKETKSSYAIERLSPDRRRAARFVTLLQQASTLECFTKDTLLHLQNAIVDERYAAHDFRHVQNYVGQSLGPEHELVHYVAPKPSDLPGLMTGWMSCCQRMLSTRVHPVVAATIAGFGFVYLHPFEDGNGRLHRFIIHHVLAAGDFGPPGIMLPLSTTILNQIDRYDATLSAYSKEVGLHVEYSLDASGVMTVTNDTACYYRYPDFTFQTEALFGFIADTLQTELLAEIRYLTVFDNVRHRFLQVADMPDRRLDLFLRICLEGKGRLSRRKRDLFKELSDEECHRLEKIVQEALAQLGKPLGISAH